jgi:hypothetical protein
MSCGYGKKGAPRVATYTLRGKLGCYGNVKFDVFYGSGY